MTPPTPRVSVLLPVWRAEATLAEALADVRAQTLSDWECVLVLDGEEDRSGDIARRVAREEPRVRVVARPHGGIVAALNAGLERARAPIVARFDADDRMAPRRLEAEVALLASRPEVGVVTCGVAFDRADAAPGGGDEGMRRHVAWLNGLDARGIRAARFIDAPVVHPAVAFRAEVVRAVGGYRQGPFAEDHDLWLRLFAAGVVFERVPEVLVTWRDRADRLTRVDRRYAEAGRRALVHGHLLAPGGPLDGRRALVWGAGEYGRRHARELIARGADVEALIDIDPKKIGRVIAGRPVVGMEALERRDRRVVLAAVAARGARELIAQELTARGYVEDVDWWALQ